ncbi:hypothetical protein CEXT_19381 [Caerostris extrusa]|uniref:Uncharacterized protein n=1 Tax=Caerostris extrusa TaxID=172846 RepID=A0AAV4Y5E9_CAEEX|nr:hypothetical protein CEXT_19381 [Caerostris extrusa]
MDHGIHGINDPIAILSSLPTRMTLWGFTPSYVQSTGLILHKYENFSGFDAHCLSSFYQASLVQKCNTPQASSHKGF